MNGYPQHPDDGSSGFNPCTGWCRQCNAVLRVVGCKIYLNDDGPFCSVECSERWAKLPFSDDVLDALKPLPLDEPEIGDSWTGTGFDLTNCAGVLT